MHHYVALQRNHAPIRFEIVSKGSQIFYRKKKNNHLKQLVIEKFTSWQTLCSKAPIQ
jgi:hypothetical protein